MNRTDLPSLVVKALRSNNNRGTIVEVSKYVWNNYKHDLEKSGDLFYTWQYDIRWAATELRKNKILKDSKLSPKGLWELS